MRDFFEGISETPHKGLFPFHCKPRRRAALLEAYWEEPNYASRALPCTTWAFVAAAMKREQTLGLAIIHFLLLINK